MKAAWSVAHSSDSTPAQCRNPAPSGRHIQGDGRREEWDSHEVLCILDGSPGRDLLRLMIRRGFIEQETGAALDNLGIFSIDIERVVKRNCENMIGTVQVPVGVAGPIRINGGHAQGNYWLPLATTEGALVASVNRGCSAITKADHFTVWLSA